MQRSGGAGPNAALHLGAARLLLVGQEFDSEGHFSNRRLLAEWWWLGSNRHFSAEKMWSEMPVISISLNS